MLGGPRVWAKTPEPFPNDPFLTGYYAPVSTESDQPQLRISGELPKELRGTLYRNGPNPQFAPRGPYHWFAGDGMIHAFHIGDGRASYMNRWVRTPKWQVEHDAGGSLDRQLRQSALHRSAISRPQVDGRQHQYRLARRPADGAGGGPRAVPARSGQPEIPASR
jgi:carotenoid cleavage dioxygenase-like enzyme